MQLPLGDDLRTPASDLADATTDSTVLAVGSAPNFPHGMIDPIAEMARIALDAGVPFHIDACLGGLLLPLLEKLGYEIPPWDFRVPGVDSISEPTSATPWSTPLGAALRPPPTATT